MTTERVPTIRMLIKQWCPSGLGAESEWLIATLEAREREVVKAAKYEGSCWMLDDIRGSLEHWPDKRCDIIIGAQVGRLLAAAKREAAASALEQAAKEIEHYMESLDETGIPMRRTKYRAVLVGDHIRSLSPIPNARALWEAEARLADAKWLTQIVPGRLPQVIRDHIAQLESAVAKLSEGREGQS